MKNNSCACIMSKIIWQPILFMFLPQCSQISFIEASQVKENTLQNIFNLKLIKTAENVNNIV